MKKLLFIAAALACIMFASCEDEKKESIVPTLGKITLSPAECNGGDTVRATVTVADQGEYCTYFKGTLSYDDASKSVGITKTDDGNLTFLFIAPNRNGNLHVSFFATMSLHAGNTLYGETNKVNTTLRVHYVEPEEEDED